MVLLSLSTKLNQWLGPFLLRQGIKARYAAAGGILRDNLLADTFCLLPVAQKLIQVEAHDEATRAALLATNLPPHMRLIIVPAGLPRTKPRALCYALTFARGDYVVVYDAEDLPDPGQLSRAHAAFENGSVNLGCLQASLAINNAHESWLTAGIMAQTPLEVNPSSP